MNSNKHLFHFREQISQLYLKWSSLPFKILKAIVVYERFRHIFNGDLVNSKLFY